MFEVQFASFPTDGASGGVNVAAATYLKNFTRRNIDKDETRSSLVGKHFKDGLLGVLLKAEPSVLKLLIEIVSNVSLIIRLTILLCILFRGDFEFANSPVQINRCC